MDLDEMLKMLQDAYIAGARGHAEWLATQRQMQREFPKGSALALMRKGDPVEDDIIGVGVCKERPVAVVG
jgi:hypothetical protein